MKRERFTKRGSREFSYGKEMKPGWSALAFRHVESRVGAVQPRVSGLNNRHHSCLGSIGYYCIAEPTVQKVRPSLNSSELHKTHIETGRSDLNLKLYYVSMETLKKVLITHQSAFFVGGHGFSLNLITPDTRYPGPLFDPVMDIFRDGGYLSDLAHLSHVSEKLVEHRGFPMCIVGKPIFQWVDSSFAFQCQAYDNMESCRYYSKGDHHHM